MHYGILLLHSAIDFDMSFFYIKFIAFVLIAMLSTYKKEEKLKAHKALQIITAIILILACMNSLYANTTFVITENITKNDNSNFELANKLAPYNIEIKEKELNYLKLQKENIERQIEICNEILKNEKAYDKISMYFKITRIAMTEIENNNDDKAKEILKLAMDVLEQREIAFPKSITNYTNSVGNIINNIWGIQKYSENIYVKQFIQESFKQARIIIKEARENITDYRVTTLSKEDFEEKCELLEMYEKNMLKIEKEL